MEIKNIVCPYWGNLSVPDDFECGHCDGCIFKKEEE